jgi:integrase/recombinase XerC
VTGGQNRGRKFPAHAVDAADAARLLEAAGEGWIGARNRALLATYYRAGLRCSEALGLSLSDVRNVPGGVVLRVERPKGFRRGAPPREVGLDPKAAGLLAAWLEFRGVSPGLLFPTRAGQPLSATYIRALVPRLGKKSGLSRRVHAHALRHTFARELYDEGVGMVEIMLALGHRRLDTTQRYLTSIGATEVIAATTKRSW